MTGAQIERERAKKRLQEQARLGREDYQAWKEKLQQLDLSRQKIKEAMGFAFDKIESAEEVRYGSPCCMMQWSKERLRSHQLFIDAQYNIYTSALLRVPF
jgi:hypothetical protein